MNITYISEEEVQKILSMDDAINCTENVYKLKSQGRTVVWPAVFYEFDPGHADMDIKSGYLPDMHIFGHKTVAFMEANISKGLPDLVGLIAVFNSETGMLSGLVDGSSVTGMRTGAAGAIGAKYLARNDSKKALIVGTGNQAPFQIAALLRVFPKLEIIRICNPHHAEKAVAFVSEIRTILKNKFAVDISSVSFEAVFDLKEAVSDSDIIITITPSRVPLIMKEWVKPGTHFSCIGADMEGKEEIDPQIFKDAIVFVDDLEYCKKAGEIEIPLKKGILGESDAIQEIGDLILNKCIGRKHDSDITIFDSTGIALLDLAVANSLLQSDSIKEDM